MNLPKVSVVIPVYNVKNYLDRCIDSVVNQTYCNIEIILVDDGSTDNSSEMCDRWSESDSRIKVIHKENEGAGFSRNRGIEESTGEYILFVDSDDFIYPETVKSCVSAARENKSEIVLYGRADVDKNGNVSEKSILTDKYVYKNGETTEELLSSLYTHSKGFGLGVCGKMFDAEVIHRNKLRFCSEREVFSEDAIFITEYFAYVLSASIVPKNYYMCVPHNDSLSHTLKKEYRQKNDVFLSRTLEICGRRGYSDNVKNHVKSRYLIYTLDGMRQSVLACMTKKEKKKIIKNYYNNKNLQAALTDNVLELGTKASEIFWKLFRLKCFGLCYVLMKLKK